MGRPVRRRSEGVGWEHCLGGSHGLTPTPQKVLSRTAPSYINNWGSTGELDSKLVCYPMVHVKLRKEHIVPYNDKGLGCPFGAVN